MAEQGAIVVANIGDTVGRKFPAIAIAKILLPYARQNVKRMKGLYYTRVQVWSDELVVFGVSGGDSV
jgi:hypothetical protein